MLYRLGRPESALMEVEEALRSDPESASGHGLRAFALLALGRVPAAREAAQSCVSQDPDWAWTHYVLGRVRRMTGLPSSAREPLDEAVRLAPEDADYRLERAWLHFEQRRFAAAIADAEDGLRLDPLLGRCAAVRGIALQFQGRMEEAETAYREALAISPDLAIAHAGLGYAALRRRKGAEAAESFRSALRLDPSYNWAQSGLPEALRLTFPGYARLDRWISGLRSLNRKWRRGIGYLLTFLVIAGFVGSFRLALAMGYGSVSGAGLLALLLIFPLACWFWALLLWVARPLCELGMRFHPVGRWLVDPVRFRTSAVLAGCGFLGFLLILLGAVGAWPRGWLLGFHVLLALPTLGFLLRNGLARWDARMGTVFLGCAVMGLVAALTPGEIGLVAMGVAYLAGFVLLLHSFYASFTET
ncbi:MAG: tetratricopeptide repeat protein [Planctomycetaceae bacterium]|nr:tetratricopeptide repeat protein [Planctomycetaceae bacterium]